MALFKKSNKNFSYILRAIDCFSKYAFAVPLKSKTADSILSGLKAIFAEQKPHKLQTDNGKEFINQKVQSYLRKQNIHFFTTKNSSFKCAIVERFNRTLKEKMFKLFTKNGNRNYIDYLKDLLHSYNTTVHSTTKMRPVDVTKNNENRVFRNIYKVNSVREYLLSKRMRPKLNIGVKVR
jgi:L-lactate utilization protein LutC